MANYIVSYDLRNVDNYRYDEMLSAGFRRSIVDILGSSVRLPENTWLIDSELTPIRVADIVERIYGPLNVSAICVFEVDIQPHKFHVFNRT